MKNNDYVIEKKPKFPPIEVPEYDFKTIESEVQDALIEFVPVEHRPI